MALVYENRRETLQKGFKNSIVMGLLTKIRQVEMRVGVDEVDLLLVLGRHLRAAVLVV